MSSKADRAAAVSAKGLSMESEATAGGRLHSMVEGARRRTPPPLLRIVTRTAGGLQAIEPFDRAMTLAAQTFTSVFPLIIAVAALLPAGSQSLPDRRLRRAGSARQLPRRPRTGAARSAADPRRLRRSRCGHRGVQRHQPVPGARPHVREGVAGAAFRRPDQRVALGCGPVRGGVVVHHGAGALRCQFWGPLRYGGHGAPHGHPEQSSVDLGAVACSSLTGSPGAACCPAASSWASALRQRRSRVACTCRGHWSAPPDSSEHSA